MTSATSALSATTDETSRDPSRNVQELVSRLEGQLDALARREGAGPASAAIDEVRESWTALVAALDLPPQPDRDCPSCNRRIMSAATLCHHCWAHVHPLH